MKDIRVKQNCCKNWQMVLNLITMLLIVGCSGVHISNPNRPSTEPKSGIIQLRWLYSLPDNVQSISLYVDEIAAETAQKNRAVVYSGEPLQLLLDRQQNVRIIGREFTVAETSYEKISFGFSRLKPGSLQLTDGTTKTISNQNQDALTVNMNKAFTVQGGAPKAVVVQLDLARSLPTRVNPETGRIEATFADSSEVLFEPAFIAEQQEFTLPTDPKIFEYQETVSYQLPIDFIEVRPVPENIVPDDIREVPEQPDEASRAEPISQPETSERLAPEVPVPPLVAPADQAGEVGPSEVEVEADVRVTFKFQDASNYCLVSAGNQEVINRRMRGCPGGWIQKMNADSILTFTNIGAGVFILGVEQPDQAATPVSDRFFNVIDRVELQNRLIYNFHYNPDISDRLEATGVREKN